MDIKGRKVLVTGADGFIGSHLVERLVQRGAQVKALSLYNSFNNWGWLETIPSLKEIEVVTGDVRDPFFCKHITKGCDAVFHLAALIAIPYSYVAPQSYVDTNVAGTLNICQAALEMGVSRIMHTSTSEVYGTAQTVPISEAHPLQPQSPYSASKIGADAMAMSYFNSFELPLVIARPFNTFGPRQSARAVIPNIIAQLASGKKQISIGDVRPTRDFNFVTDTADGMIALVECDQAVGKTVNIGSGREISIRDLFIMIKEMMGAQGELVVDESRLRPEKSEVMRLLADSRLLKSLTGYEPQMGLEKGLKITADWFQKKENLGRYKVDIYNI